jgi:aspartate aminotransferase-like enzyme
MYFDYNDYISNMKRGQTPYTPAVGIMYEIHDMLSAITEMRLEVRLGEVKDKAESFRNELISEGISIPEFNCSNAITTVVFEKPVAKEVERELIETLGYIINPCGGNVATQRFRVSHVGAVTVEETVQLAKAIKEIYKKY